MLVTGMVPEVPPTTTLLPTIQRSDPAGNEPWFWNEVVVEVKDAGVAVANVTSSR